MQKQPEATLHHRYHFPTVIHQNTRGFQFRNIGIFDREDNVTAWKLDRLPLRDLVLNAWAILLRCYVRSETITFLTVSDSLGPYDIGSTKSKLCLGEDIEAVRLQYQLSDDLLLHEMCPYETTNATDYKIGDAPVHTMIHFSSWRTTSTLQENQSHTLSTIAEDAAYIDNVCLIFTAIDQDVVKKNWFTFRKCLQATSR